MNVKLSARGSLRKYITGGDMPGETVLSIPEGSSCADALAAAGIDWQGNKSFGFVSVNGMRVMIDELLHDGDLLKAFPKVGGG